jgi:outer membrane protein assembly factor BamB
MTISETIKYAAVLTRFVGVVIVFALPISVIAHFSLRTPSIMINTRSRFFCTAIIVAHLSLTATASDWPKWLGPTGENSAPEDGPFNPDLKSWKIAWTKNVGLGYSSLAVVGDRAYTMGHDGKSKENVYCLNASTGESIWSYSYEAPLIPHLHTGGPNATPTVIGNKVITLSKNGLVFCFSADKGEVIWQANLLELFGIKLPQWGFASSALVEGNQVLFCGGKVCALALDTGKMIWTTKTAYLPAGYAQSPVFDFDGKKCVAALDGKGLSILSATDGAEITRHPFKALFDMNATTPVILDHGKHIFIANTVQSEMLSFDGSKLTTDWSIKELRNVMNNSVIQDGSIYGITGEQQQTTNSVVSIKESDGKENWSQPAIGYGTTIGIGKTLLILTERGELITAKIDPAKYTEISRRKVLDEVCWTTPTYANGKIFLRNDKGNVVVLGQ